MMRQLLIDILSNKKNIEDLKKSIDSNSIDELIKAVNLIKKKLCKEDSSNRDEYKPGPLVTTAVKSPKVKEKIPSKPLNYEKINEAWREKQGKPSGVTLDYSSGKPVARQDKVVKEDAMSAAANSIRGAFGTASQPSTPSTGSSNLGTTIASGLKTMIGKGESYSVSERGQWSIKKNEESEQDIRYIKAKYARDKSDPEQKNLDFARKQTLKEQEEARAVGGMGKLHSKKDLKKGINEEKSNKDTLTQLRNIRAVMVKEEKPIGDALDQNALLIDIVDNILSGKMDRARELYKKIKRPQKS